MRISERPRWHNTKARERIQATSLDLSKLESSYSHRLLLNQLWIYFDLQPSGANSEFIRLPAILACIIVCYFLIQIWWLLRITVWILSCINAIFTYDMISNPFHKLLLIFAFSLSRSYLRLGSRIQHEHVGTGISELADILHLRA